MLSLASAETVTEPDTVVPPLGAVIDTTGAVVSGGTLVTLTTALVVVLLAPSRARADKVCGPLVAVALFQAMEYGALVSSAPSAAPSSSNCTAVTATLSLASAET